MADYVVGDIQGCFDGLQRLLQHIHFDPTSDTLTAVGDLVGRGPQSLQTLDYLINLGERFQTVLGNHDLHLLAVYCGIRKKKASDKFDALLASPNIKRYISWLRAKPLALTLGDNVLVTHAGLYPSWSTAQALALSTECQLALQSADWKTLLSHMYGDEPSRWQADLAGNDRLRFIINAFTRMRYMQDAETLDFSCKEAPALAPSSLTPWFKISNKQLHPDTKLVFGHWATLAGYTSNPQMIALDTGYIWGQQMTCWQRQNQCKYTIDYQE
ncbi:MAG: symmetrical bis(5'-nucleosyl)-tetraphosphatase [Paraglaciecola sp.]|nr:symmetrical bis(5'-nucleosyl)-tetraphosphatase [Paraglaciecola sp.]NCT47270.1 symmetrical bis(5'-nucleosyl)-tetraphosphatase [Paraglaciecola sp.]